MPTSKEGYDIIFVVIDRFSKQAVFLSCYKTVTAEDMARLYINAIYRHKGPPDSIVSDRGPQFVSYFWKKFCRILGIKLKLSTAFHPQTDG
jgi:transposase InsO family protein